MEATTLYDQWGVNGIVVTATFAAVLATAFTHFEGLRKMSAIFAHPGRRRESHRRVVLYAVLCLIGLHIIEIWIFGLVYHVLLLWPSVGQISGAISHSLLDHVYFSATVYTSVGFGDLSPTGPIRFMAGTEALAGLVMIGWSASFTYLEMEQQWKQ